MNPLLLVIILSVLTLFGEIGQMIWMPLWVDASRPLQQLNTTTTSDSGTYAICLLSSTLELVVFIILFLIFGKKKNLGIGKYLIASSIANSVQNFFIPYLSNTSRNAATIQAVLINSYVPLTVIMRLFWMKKLPSWKKAICVLAIIAGLVICVIPDVTGMNQSETSDTSEIMGIHVLWIFAYIFFAVFLQIVVNIIVEILLKEPEASSISSNAYEPLQEENSYDTDALVHPIVTQRMEKPDLYYTCLVLAVAQFFFSLILFWIDIIPGFGYSANMKEFSQNIAYTTKCSFGVGEKCSQTPGFATGFVISYVLSYIFGFALIKYGEGSLFWALNENLVTPSAVIFWILFSQFPLRWNPHFKKTDIFSVVATVIIFPVLIVYTLVEKEHTIEWVDSNISIAGYRLKKIRLVEGEENSFPIPLDPDAIA